MDYRANFKKAEQELVEKGHIVINPAMLPSGLGDNEDYMHICLPMIDKCDAIYLLDGWEDSRGACREYDYAEANWKTRFIGGIS